MQNILEVLHYYIVRFAYGKVTNILVALTRITNAVLKHPLLRFRSLLDLDFRKIIRHRPIGLFTNTS